MSRHVLIHVGVSSIIWYNMRTEARDVCRHVLGSEASDVILKHQVHNNEHQIHNDVWVQVGSKVRNELRLHETR